MTSADQITAWTGLLAAVSAALGGVAVIARIIVKRFPPRSVSLAAEVAAAKAEIAQIKAEAREEVTRAQTEAREEIAQIKKETSASVAALEGRVSDCMADVRVLSDYAHDLREHVAKGLPPPPPDWPKELRQ